MKIKFLIFSMILGLSLAMIGCDTITSVVSPVKKAEAEQMEKKAPEEPQAMAKKEEPKKMEAMKKAEPQSSSDAMATTKTDTPQAMAKKEEPKKMEPKKMEPKAATLEPQEAPKKKVPPLMVKEEKEEVMVPKASTATAAPAPKAATAVPAPKAEVASLSPQADSPKKVPPLMIRKAEEPMVKAPEAKSMTQSETIPELNVIYFEFDKSRIQDQFKADLQENFEWIQKNPNVKIQLEGHADERGTNEYNLALGERRSNSILDYLIALGANPEQFSIISFGEERPSMLNCDDENCYVLNRRVEFTRL